MDKKNVAIIDIERYDDLVNAQNILNEFYNDEEELCISFKNKHGLLYNYKIITNDEMLEEIGEKYNDLMENSVHITEYKNLKKELENIQEELKDAYAENRAYFETIQNLKRKSIKEFIKWKKNNKE